MFSHVTIGSNDLERAGKFYDALLEPLGLRQRKVIADTGPKALCFANAAEDLPYFYIYAPFDRKAATPGNGTMVAFIANSPAAVDAAFASGMANGGRSEGEPGERPHYAKDYYGAYLRDPDGNKLHLVYRGDKLKRPASRPI